MVLHYTKLHRLARNKHTSLLGLFVSYKENELLWGGSLGLYCSYLMKVPNKMVSHYTKLQMLASNKHTSLLGLFISYKENEVLWIFSLGVYSQYFIFYITQEYSNEILLQYTKLESFARNKHTRLLGLFISYKENEVFWIFSLGLYSYSFIFFITQECYQ
jgi:hypothetical protein